jgi:hypothetical protein
MDMTTTDIIGELVKQIIPLARDGSFPEIAQIDFVACEDERSCSVQVHLTDETINGDLPVTCGFDIGDLLREEITIGLCAAGIMHTFLGARGALGVLGEAGMPRDLSQ